MLELSVQTPEPAVLLKAFPEGTLNDAVNHYNGYSRLPGDKTQGEYFFRIPNGHNPNYTELLMEFTRLLDSDNQFFLSKTAELTEANVSLLVCRFFAICDGLTSSALGH